MAILFLIILGAFLVSLVSFIGVFTLSLNEKILKKTLFYFVALSVGGLMGGAFLHLLPEAIEKLGDVKAFLYVLIGFFLFFIIEKVIHWRHCHEGHCPIHTFAYMNLIGDGIHNFIDGLIMAAGFIVSPGLGIASTIAIFLHEIPQEIGDFGVLIYAGINKKRALLLNFLTAITAVLGGIFGFYLLSFAESVSGFLLAFAAGGFIYIAATDLVPELDKEKNIKKSIFNFIIIFFGIAIMYLLKFLEI
ncbi:MAG: zinc/iron permease [Parcubacteria group bacterium Licking1014_1]|nr:MAG: zinc/iron permease [Parcubacteria group bacterium Licking1014_1]